MTDSASLDPFLEGPHQRALTRVIRQALHDARSLVLAYGDASAAERLVAALARTFPDQQAHLWLLDVGASELTPFPQTSTARSRSVVGVAPPQVVRSLLRQDADGIAVTRLEEVGGELLANALFTGHLVLLGAGAATVESVIHQLVSGDRGLEGQVRARLELACELDGQGRLRRVFRGDGKGALREVAAVEDGGVVVREAAGTGVQTAPPAERALRSTPAPTARPAPTRAPRPAFLLHTDATASSRSLLGTRQAHRPAGAGWPRCRQCGEPLALIVQLDLSRLPEPFSRGEGLGQLFLCHRGGCEVVDERSRGVLAEVIDADGVEVVEAPESLEVEVLAPGAIVDLSRFEEDPGPEDLDRLGLLVAGDDRLALPMPRRCDKLGGWPSWEQGLGWPLDETGRPMDLLFQFAESAVLSGGSPDRWDDESASLVRGPRARPVLDPDSPCHFPSVLTAEAVGFLFWTPGTKRLAFRWQTG